MFDSFELVAQRSILSLGPYQKAQTSFSTQTSTRLFACALLLSGPTLRVRAHSSEKHPAKVDDSDRQLRYLVGRRVQSSVALHSSAHTCPIHLWMAEAATVGESDG